MTLVPHNSISNDTEITDDIDKVPTKRADFNGSMSETSSHKTSNDNIVRTRLHSQCQEVKQVCKEITLKSGNSSAIASGKKEG